MTVEAFLDTNVLIYAAAGHHDTPAKCTAALALLDAVNFGLSGQVLAEFYANVTRKPKKPLSPEEALGWVDRVAFFPVIPVDADLIRIGIAHSLRYQLSYWDGAIVAAAERLNAKILYSEDFNHGQSYGSVRAENPFRKI